VNNAVASVTVLAPNCMRADAWATALLVAGPVEGLVMAQRVGIEVLFLLRRSEGLEELGLGRFGISANRPNLVGDSNSTTPVL
jgi:thiamine biosynthesis lipoprotein